MRFHEFLFYRISVLCILQIWGCNFEDDLNTASFAIAIIVMVYFLLFFKRLHLFINAEHEDEDDFLALRYGYIKMFY